MAEKTRGEKYLEKLATTGGAIDAAKSQEVNCCIDKLSSINAIVPNLANAAAVADADAKRQKTAELDAQLEEAARCVATIKRLGGKVPTEYVKYE